MNREASSVTLSSGDQSVTLTAGQLGDAWCSIDRLVEGVEPSFSASVVVRYQKGNLAKILWR